MQQVEFLIALHLRQPFDESRSSSWLIVSRRRLHPRYSDEQQPPLLFDVSQFLIVCEIVIRAPGQDPLDTCRDDRSRGGQTLALMKAHHSHILNRRAHRFLGDKSKWAEAPGRAAAIYVFAHHPVFDPTVADHRNQLQWGFYVLPASFLPPQKTIGLSGLLALPTMRKAKFGSLLETVSKCLTDLRRV